jgi:hypothetical protein
MPTPKWFTVATEGQTTDGRVIERAWLEQIAQTYSQKTYGARVSVEHLISLIPDSIFRAYGDVTAAQTIETDGKLQLQVQIDPTPELVALSKSRQKIYTSIEVDPNFAKSGKAYLTGLAVTDTPASLGTDILAFAAQNPDKHPYASRKRNADCLFSSALETVLDFAEEEPSADDKTPKLFQRLRELLSREKANDTDHFKQVEEAVTQLAEHVTAKFTAGDKLLKEMADRFDTFAKKYVSAETFNQLKEQLDNTPRSFTPMKPATGTDASQRADC